jgi:hypothetical protein
MENFRNFSEYLEAFAKLFPKAADEFGPNELEA